MREYPYSWSTAHDLILSFCPVCGFCSHAWLFPFVQSGSELLCIKHSNNDTAWIANRFRSPPFWCHLTYTVGAVPLICASSLLSVETMFSDGKRHCWNGSMSLRWGGRGCSSDWNMFVETCLLSHLILISQRFQLISQRGLITLTHSYSHEAAEGILSQPWLTQSWDVEV